MSTRSRIGVKNEDGTITSIYCHFDGYPKGGVGEDLLRYHNSKDAAYALMLHGDISSLFPFRPYNDGKNSVIHRDESAFLDYACYSSADWIYLWSSEWLCLKNYKNKSWKILVKAILENN